MNTKQLYFELTQDRVVTSRLAVSYGGPPAPMLNGASTLPSILRSASLLPAEKGILYLDSNGEEFQPYSVLLEESSRLLAGLRTFGLKPHDRVIFQLEKRRHFLTALWACILGGMIPIPMMTAPTYEGPNQAVARLQYLSRMLDNTMLLTEEALASGIHSLPGLGSVRVMIIEELYSSIPDGELYEATPSEPALLLLTSGSTGDPKIVMLTHHNVLCCIAGSSFVSGYTAAEVSLTWSNLHHVAVLMRSFRDIYLGCHQIQAPTSMVLRDPLIWLDWIDRHRVTTTWVPNYAFGAAVERLAQNPERRPSDLSCMTSLYTSGEIISAPTVKKFCSLLSSRGLNFQAMHIAWGMTEASSAAYSRIFENDFDENGPKFPEVGRPIPGIAFRIVDERDEIVDEEVEGRLQIKGPLCMTQYLDSPELNRESFTADGWFKTGDLGFLREGRLTVTGREKDVIVIRGQKHSHHEIEVPAQEIAGVQASSVAACAVRMPGTDTDQLAIFFQTRVTKEDDLRRLLLEIRSVVTRGAGVCPVFLIPVEADAIPRTPTGKIMRAELKRRLELGAFDSIRAQVEALLHSQDTLRPAPPVDPVVSTVCAIFADVLGLEQVSPQGSFFSLGGGSLQVARAVGMFAELFPAVPITTVEIFRFQTPEKLADFLQQKNSKASPVLKGTARAGFRRAKLPENRVY